MYKNEQRTEPCLLAPCAAAAAPGRWVSAAGLSERNFCGVGKLASTRIAARMFRALCNWRCRLRAVAKRKGCVRRESNQTSALNRCYRARLKACAWGSNRKGFVFGKSRPGRVLRTVVLRVRARGSDTPLSRHHRAVMEVRAAQRTRSQPPNQPMERTPPRCALRRPSPARWASA